MKSFFFLVVILQLTAQIVSSQKIVGCYWGSWTSISQINVKLCTHAYFAFYTTDSNGVITTTSSDSAFIGLKSQNPSVKLLASIGGYNAGTAAFSAIAASSSKLATFVSNCVTLAQNYDGIDLDWEYPQQSEQQSFVNMLSALKSALNAKGKILAIAASAGNWQISQSYSISSVCSNVDIMNLMSYDLNWPTSATGPNAGYSVVNDAVSTWLNGGCPASKLVLGLASYGYNYALSSPSSNGVGASASSASAIPYRSICQKLNAGGWTTQRTDQTPYSYKGSEWISYDDVTSLTAKLNIVSSRNLAGAFFWSTEQDDYDNSCGGGAYPLITAVSKALGVASGTATTKAPATLTTTKAPIATTTTKAPTQATTTKTTTKASTGITCTSNGYFAYPGDCTRFYWCVNGYPYIYQCGTGLGWNQSYQTCDYKYNIPGCV